MNWPSISVIVPTYQREEPLRDTLTDVLNQDYPDFEVLVVDQTQTHEPETTAYLRELEEQGKIRWLRLKWASLPGARNYGVRQSQGDIIVFIDDDVRMEAGYLKAHAQAFLDHPEVGGVAGRVLDRMIMSNAPEGFTLDYLPSEAMDPGIAWYYLDLVHTTQPQQVISARGCNMAFRRELFDQHNLRFDERFRGSAVREESDFCLDIRRTGYKIWYTPDAALVHLGEPTGGCHDISTRSLKYQVTHYHNHFLMSFKHLTVGQCLRLYWRLFDCHVLGHPPCHKSGSPVKVFVRGIFYTWGFFSAIGTQIKSIWDDGQIYTRQSLSPEAEAKT
jgi:GT2 family glycosyltransferase